MSIASLRSMLGKERAAAAGDTDAIGAALEMCSVPRNQDGSAGCPELPALPSADELD
jgi:hypothetical protein